MTQEKQGRGCLTAMGAFSVVAGFIAIGSPLMTGAFVASLIGAMLLLNGLMELAGAFSADGWKAGLLAFLGGGLAILAGGTLMARPLVGAALIGTVLIVFFFVDGLARIVLALKLRPMPGWGLGVAGGVATVILGAMIWRGWPLSGMWAIGVLVGVRILFAGMAMLTLRGAVAEAKQAG